MAPLATLSLDTTPSTRPTTIPCLGASRLRIPRSACACAQFATHYQKAYGEPVVKLAQREAAQALADNFLLAAPRPTEAECKLSLSTSLAVLLKP